MNNTDSRLEELFSAERLRQNWQSKVIAVPESVQNKRNLDIHARYRELQRLIAKKFSDTSRLSGRFDELTEQINQTFPLDATADSSDVKSKESTVLMLEQLEELLWALDLSLRAQR